MLVVVLPDGTPGTVAADATDVFGGAAGPRARRCRDESPDHHGPCPTTVLTVAGARHLRELLALMREPLGSPTRPKTRK
jgi:hypothetical protein